MDTTHDRRNTAADEMLAYDLVEALIKREGLRTVLATLRAWCLLLDTKSRKGKQIG